MKQLIESCFKVDNRFTILSFGEPIIGKTLNKAFIDGKEYDTEIVYDMPNSIGIKTTGDFEGKYAEFD